MPLCQEAQRCAIWNEFRFFLKICMWQCKIKETKIPGRQSEKILPVPNL